MRTSFKSYKIIFTILALLLPYIVDAQHITVNIGIQDSIQSEILKETRKILIHIPDSYKDSNKRYPVLYRLDGNTDLLLETTSIVNRLTYADEVTPEMIIVAIENTNRSKDMWPVNTKYYPVTYTAGANDFLSFIEKELIPFIENKYRTNKERILCGQSLSGIFTSYAFLSKPALFNSYIISSGAFPDCENYFKELSDKAFQHADRFNGIKIFITNGTNDPLDPDGEMNRQIAEFTNSLNQKLGNKIRCKYVIYENEGHVPFHSLYDGLRFIYEPGLEK